MVETKESPVIKNALRDVTSAVIATIATLICAVFLFMMVPHVQLYMKSSDDAMVHKRKFIKSSTGGAIEYSAGKDRKNQQELMLTYKEDLQILARRFQRGQFEMSTLPGFKNSKLGKKLSNRSTDFQYTVSTRGDDDDDDDGVAQLQIKARNQAAILLIHEYLTYLEKRWVFLP